MLLTYMQTSACKLVTFQNITYSYCDTQNKQLGMTGLVLNTPSACWNVLLLLLLNLLGVFQPYNTQHTPTQPAMQC